MTVSAEWRPGQWRRSVGTDIEWHPALPDGDECRARLERLSLRHREILRALSGGWTVKEIARQLGIAQNTVHNHLCATCETLDVRPPDRAVALYRRAVDVEHDLRRAS